MYKHRRIPLIAPSAICKPATTLCHSLQLSFLANPNLPAMLFSAATFTLAVATAASALTITAPDSNGVSWTSASGDPEAFSIELRDTNTPSVISPLAIANNVNTSAGTHSLQLPPVPDATTYQLEFVNVTNINQVYATSVTFPIVNQAQPTTSPAASSGTVTGTSLSASGSATSTVPASTASAAPNAALALNIPAVAPIFFASLALLV
ncbi:hypothetical protein FRC06_003905 [Ceratobasidium sp. 370]|nr:hypothetical protein FRC06_003905 [Ceratobasidium sp. 370]